MPGLNRKASSALSLPAKRPAWGPLAVALRFRGQLIKITLCLPVALSAGFGFVLHTPTFTPALGGVFCGVLLLACGAAGGNSLQEAATDACLRRTQDRPLVTGRLGKHEALGLCLVLVLLGLTTLLVSGQGRLPFWLGLAAIFFYNGIYTPLKQVSVFALIPGGLAGSLPPLIGWTGAGGGLADSRAWLLLTLFFLWQIPHFCLILLRYQEEYRNAAQPSLIRLFSEPSLKRIVLVWIGAFAVVTLALALDRDLLQPGSRLLLALMAMLLPAFLGLHLLRHPSPDYRLLGTVFNGVFFATLILVTLLQLLTIG